MFLGYILSYKLKFLLENTILLSICIEIIKCKLRESNRSEIIDTSIFPLKKKKKNRFQIR